MRFLRALLARQRALIEDLRRERNRLEKVEATHTPALVRDSVRESIAFLEEALAKLQQQIDDHLDGHPQLREDVDLLTSIPAVGLKVAQRFVALLQSRPFTSAQQFAAYLGLVPVERQSGTSVQGRARLSKAGPAHARAPSTWPPSPPFATTHTSRTSTNASWRAASPRWSPSAPPCGNSPTSVSACSRTVVPTSPITLPRLDGKDGIFAVRSSLQ
ncbi:IS110 family transposase [Marichromatium sp. AB31]|nr:IS110 family transposase [Marichromatium sp. AB31]